MSFGSLKGTPGEPYNTAQESFLCNLAKMLNEGDDMNINRCIRWHLNISNALQVNWSEFDNEYDRISPILVSYKVFRAKNKRQCARASWNRKLREWNFQMIHIHGPWTTYIYKGILFNRESLAYDLPVSRRPRKGTT